MKAKVEHLDEIGEINFKFIGDPVELEVHVFQVISETIFAEIFFSWTEVSEWEGLEKETEEMRPQWFAESEIPFKQMWLDDELWYPHLLKNDKFKGYFLFKGHDKILDYTLTVL